MRGPPSDSVTGRTLPHCARRVSPIGLLLGDRRRYITEGARVVLAESGAHASRLPRGHGGLFHPGGRRGWWPSAPCWTEHERPRHHDRHVPVPFVRRPRSRVRPRRARGNVVLLRHIGGHPGRWQDPGGRLGLQRATSSDDLVFARYLSNGTLDTAFGDQGMVLTDG